MLNISQIEYILNLPETESGHVSAVQIQTYINLLLKWNSKINLTSVRSAEEILLRHVADSLAGLKLIRVCLTGTLADFGSGAGIPGIFAAMAYPALTVYSIDSILKKIEFQHFCRQELQLQNYYPLQMTLQSGSTRAKDNPLIPLQDSIICRAFSDTQTVLNYALQYLKQGGTVFIWKSPEQRVAETRGLSDSAVHIGEVSFDRSCAGEYHIEFNGVCHSGCVMAYRKNF